MLAMICKQ